VIDVTRATRATAAVQANTAMAGESSTPRHAGSAAGP